MRFFLSAPLTAIQTIDRFWFNVFVSLFFLSSLLLQPFEINAQQCGPNSSNPPIGGPQYNQPAPAGPFFLRLYIYRVAQSNGSNAVDISAIPIIVDKLNEYYNPHNIYFALACVPAPINNTYYWINPEELLNSSYYQSTTDGINLFIVPSDAPTGTLQGSAMLSSNVCWSKYFPDCKTIAHEVGHVLGLYHTFKGAACSGEPGIPENVDGSNGTTAGDEVADTPADPGVYTSIDANCIATVSPNCTDGQGQPYPPLPYPENIMSYGGDCRKKFSNGQGERMRTTIEDKTSVYGYTTEPTFIAQNTTWQGADKYFDTDLIVKSPNSLTINNKIHMAPGKRIVVEAGATLRVAGGTITNWANAPACYQASTDFWLGIELVSADVANGLPARVYTSGGATIEHAASAFFYRPPMSITYPYGIVNASASNFLNNRVTIDFQAFAPQNNNFNTITTNNFSDCNFIINEDYLGDEPFLAHAFLTYVGKAKFAGCVFKNELYESQYPGDFTWAIKSFQVRSLTVQSRCEVAIPFPCNPCSCPSQYLHPSEIDGFTWGIEAFANQDIMTYTVDDVSFKHVGKGIESNAVNNFKVINSDFDLGIPQVVGFPIGLQINTGTGFTVTGNSFSASGSFLSTARGIEVINTGTEANVIRENDFSLRTGIYVFGNNRDFVNPLKGLQLLCNRNLNQPFGTDFRMDQGTTVAKDQGSLAVPAGNEFTSGMISPNIRNDFNDKFNYFFKNGTTNQEPTVSNVDKIASNNNPTCGTSQEDEKRTLQDWQTAYESSKFMLDNLEAQHATLLNGGNTNSLLSSIAGATLQGKSQLKGQLDGISPWLSASVLKAMYDRYDLFSDEERYQLLEANPDELWSIEFMNYLESSPHAIAEAYLNTLKSTPLTVTSRTSLESDMSYYQSAVSNAINGAVLILLDPGEGIAVDYTALRDWLEREGTLEGALDVASTWISEDNFSAWQSYVNGIAQQVNLTSEQSDDLDRYLQMGQTIEAAKSEYRTLDKLNTAELNTILSIANHNDRYVSRLAKNILEMFYGYSFPSLSGEGGGEGQRQVKARQTDTHVKKTLQAIVTDGQVNIQTNTETGGSVTVCDITGRIVFAGDFAPGTRQIPLSRHDFTPGIYFFRINSDNADSMTGSFVVN